MNQNHYGSGDNFAGHKYEYIIHSIQTRDLAAVIRDVMQDISYWTLDEANKKLQTLKNISSLEEDVLLLLDALCIKVELVRGSKTLSKNSLLTLLQHNKTPKNVLDLVTAILIDFESRTCKDSAREIYTDSKSNNIYIQEAFFEYLASKQELESFYAQAKKYNLSEQEITGLIRGAIRLDDFEFALKLAQQLDNSFPSTNSKAFLIHVESCLLTTQKKDKYFISLSKQTKMDIDRLIEQLLIDTTEHDDLRYIATLVNLLTLSEFSDVRLYNLAKLNIDRIRGISSEHANNIEKISSLGRLQETKFEFTSNSLDLEKINHLDLALEKAQIQTATVIQWLERGGGN